MDGESRIRDANQIFPPSNALRPNGESRNVEQLGTEASALGAVPVKINPYLESLSFVSADLVDVLQWMSTKTGLVFDIDETAKAKISLDIRDIDVWDALTIICQTTGLAYEKYEGRVRVMPAEQYQQRNAMPFHPERKAMMVRIVYADREGIMVDLNAIKSDSGRVWLSKKTDSVVLLDTQEKLQDMARFIKQKDVPLITEIFYLKYILVEELKDDIRRMLTDHVGRVEYDKRSNQIVVTDTQAVINQIAEFIYSKDVKQEIVIEAKVIQVQLIEEHEQGIDWEAIVSEYQRMSLKDKQEPGLFLKDSFSAGIVTDEDYKVLLEALDTVGQVTNLTELKTSAIVNFESQFVLAAKPPHQVSREHLTGEDDQEPSLDIYQDGVEVYIKTVPMFNDDNATELNLAFRFQGLRKGQLITESRKDPRKGWDPDLLVKLKDNETVVIGGLLQEKELETTSKIPLLGDIPFLGVAFRHQDRLVEVREYVIFLSARKLPER